MPVHNSVIELLESQNVHYNITDTQSRSNLSLVTPPSGSCMVTSLLVQDAKDSAQVLLPADNILDLEALSQQFGRRFEGLSGAEIRPMISELNLSAIPAIPSWQGMPTYVEESLLQKDKLLLESGNRDQGLELNQKSFSAMVEGATTGNFSIKAPELSVNREGDEHQIMHSLQRFTERRIRQRLSETLELPPLPETAQRIIKLRADPNADISDLTNIVEIDPSLAAQVVSWAACESALN